MLKNWGFCGPTYQAISPNIDAEEAINLFCERSESSGAKVPIAMLRTPGLKIAYQLPEPGVLGEFTVNGRTFAACSKLYELFADGTFVSRGDLGGFPAGPTQMIANETQLLAMNNGNLYVLTLATNVFAAVNMAQLNGPVAQIDFTDGFGIATIQNSHTFQVSNLEDFTTWDGLNISTVSLFPDNLTSMICDHREPWFFSGKRSAAYYNAGAGFPPFIPIEGAFLEDGAAAAFATVRADNSIFWLALDERGTLVAKRANGYTGQRVSTHAVEFAWQQYAKSSDAVAYTYQENGHTFWVIRFPTADATWVYDIATGYWHKRAFWNTQTGRYSAHRSTCHTYNFGKHLVGDWASGNIYEMSSAIYDDFGNPRVLERITPTVYQGNAWLYFREIEFGIEPGLGSILVGKDDAGNPVYRAPEILLDWSDNGGKTWSNTYHLPCGKIGEYNARARKMQLGRSRKRVFRVRVSDPVAWTFIDAYLGNNIQG